MKKKLPIVIGIVIFVLLLGTLIWWRGKKTREAQILPSPTPEGQLIEITLEEQPYITLTPRTDGREFTLEITRIKNAETIEYELVYLTRGLSRGVIGTVNLQGETSIARKLLLGTCSRGVCKYDEDVTEGTLTLRLRGPDGARKFVSDFHLQRGVNELTSGDGKFKLAGKLPSGTFYIAMSTVGLPGEIEGRVVGGPYGVFTSGSETVKNGTLTMVLFEKTPSVKLYWWDGTSWIEEKEDFETNGETVSASVDSLGTFIAVASE
jgi:hypothetical protein